MQRTVSRKKTVKAKATSIEISANKKSTKKTSKKVLKEFKKSSKGFLIAVLVTLLLTLVLGFGVSYFTKDTDYFNIIGNDELTLTLEETYADEGAKVREFGLNFSGLVKTESNLKQDANGNYYSNEVGTFYIKYTVSSIKYGLIYKVQKIRLITFVEPSEPSEMIGGN